MHQLYNTKFPLSWPRERLRSFGFALGGLGLLVRQEANARIHLAASLAVVAAGWAVQLGWSDWRWIVVAMAMVWMAEAFNTAIENLCDRLSPGFDPAIGRIKDIAASAVLAAAAGAALIGLLTFVPHVLERLP